MEKFDKYADLARQRIASFNAIGEGINKMIENVNSSQESHFEGANKKTVVDSASAWIAHTATNALEKGRKAGYAEACNDVVPLLQNILQVINEEKKTLDDLLHRVISELKEDESPDEEQPQDNDTADASDRGKSDEVLSPLVLEES